VQGGFCYASTCVDNAFLGVGSSVTMDNRRDFEGEDRRVDSCVVVVWLSGDARTVEMRAYVKMRGDFYLWRNAGYK